MTLNQLYNYFNGFLKVENYGSDPSMNGIQIQNREPDSKEIKKVAFAVDACEETALKAAELGADVLFVHHGLFWGHSETITGSHYKRIAAFINNDLALMAFHIPLDANAEVGNNFGMAKRLGMINTEPFAFWRGMSLGVKGELVESMTAEELAEKALRQGKKAEKILKLGKEKIKTVGICSGGASEDVAAAVEEGLDAFITGEFQHEQFHFAKEMKINVIAGGHYETETVGVSLVAEKLQRETGIETVFIESETGL